MAKFTAGQAIVTTDSFLYIPAGTRGVVEKIHGEWEKPDMDGVRGYYAVRFSEKLLPRFAEEGNVWNYFDTEIAPVGGAQ